MSSLMSSRAMVELLRGQGAHADPIACIEDLSAELAARQVAGFPHSIGQLIHHMNYWMRYELKRICGEKPEYPEHNAESFPTELRPFDTHAWDELKKDFIRLLSEFAVLAESSPEEMARPIASGHGGDQQLAGTLEVAHNTYHAGQIAMIRRVLGAWPPRGGGDSW